MQTDENLLNILFSFLFIDFENFPHFGIGFIGEESDDMDFTEAESVGIPADINVGLAVGPIFSGNECGAAAADGGGGAELTAWDDLDTVLM